MAFSPRCDVCYLLLLIFPELGGRPLRVLSCLYGCWKVCQRGRNLNALRKLQSTDHELQSWTWEESGLLWGAPTMRSGGRQLGPWLSGGWAHLCRSTKMWKQSLGTLEDFGKMWSKSFEVIRYIYLYLFIYLYIHTFI